jgi:uncharacterized damage-inducible protein DinB
MIETMSQTKHGRKEKFLEVFGQEHERTMRVLRAFPTGKDDLRPHPKGRTAREVAWTIALGEGLMIRALTTGFDWSKPRGKPPESPGTVGEITNAVEQNYQGAVEALRGLDETNLDETVQFFVAPKKLGDFTKHDFLWFLLHDQIHHRGQLSVYVRMADGQVPSIYGPSSDEPWF